MSARAIVDQPEAGAAADRSATGLWWLILRKELTDLWLGGRLLPLLILFSILISITSLLREVESQVNLIPPSEMVFLTLLSTISFGMLISLIIGADSISGERERATLEPLLLAPASRRQIVFGKLLAALSPWPVALLLSVPYVFVLSEGDDILGLGLLWTAMLGSLLAVAFAGFGMLVSMWSRSNRTSLFVSLFAYLLFLIPTQFPGSAQKGALGYALQQVNPMQASSEFLEKLIVNNRTPEERIGYLVANILSAIVIVGVLFLYAAPRLQLEGGSPRLGRPKHRTARVAAIVVAVGLVSLSVLVAPPSSAVAATVGVAPSLDTTHPSAVVASGLEISIDKEFATVKTGDEIEFTTQVTNTADAASSTSIVAMNIIDLRKGDPVDPEDWSPERTQDVEPLEPGAQVEQSWTVEAILDGDYMVYMTVIADPEGADATSLPITSPGIHLTVVPFQNTNPGGVLPIALGMPLGLVVISVLLRRYWRRDRVRAVETEAAS